MLYSIVYMWHESETISAFKDRDARGGRRRMQVDSSTVERWWLWGYLNPFISATVSQHISLNASHSSVLDSSRSQPDILTSPDSMSSWKDFCSLLFAFKTIKESHKEAWNGGNVSEAQRLNGSENYSQVSTEGEFEIIMMELLVKWICGYRVMCSMSGAINFTVYY